MALPFQPCPPFRSWHKPQKSALLASGLAGTAQGKSKRNTYTTECFTFMLMADKMNDHRASVQTIVDDCRSRRSRRATAEIRASRWYGWGKASRSRRSSGERSDTGLASERPRHRHYLPGAAPGSIGARLAQELADALRLHRRPPRPAHSFRLVGEDRWQDNVDAHLADGRDGHRA